MNTERDNFYDWAKDKPDTTRSSALNASSFASHKATTGSSPWARLAVVAFVVIALSAAYRFFLS